MSVEQFARRFHGEGIMSAPKKPPAVSHESGQPWELPQLATFLNVSKKTLERAIKAKKLKAIRINRRVLIPDLEARRVAEAGM